MMHWYRPKLTAEGASQESQGSSCPLITFLLTLPSKKIRDSLVLCARESQLGRPDMAVVEIPTNSIGHGNLHRWKHLRGWVRCFLLCLEKASS
jgi:hypothetical protein